MAHITEDQFKAGYEAAVETAESFNESIREIHMNGDKVEIYGITNDNLKAIENAFYKAAQLQIMKTEKELKEELKEALSYCSHVNDGSLAAHVHENITWAWNNWDIDFSKYYDGVQKPESYTPLFRDEWIDNQPFDTELEQINSPAE